MTGNQTQEYHHRCIPDLVFSIIFSVLSGRIKHTLSKSAYGTTLAGTTSTPKDSIRID